MFPKRGHEGAISSTKTMISTSLAIHGRRWQGALTKQANDDEDISVRQGCRKIGMSSARGAGS